MKKLLRLLATNRIKRPVATSNSLFSINEVFSFLGILGLCVTIGLQLRDSDEQRKLQRYNLFYMQIDQLMNDIQAFSIDGKTNAESIAYLRTIYQQRGKPPEYLLQTHALANYVVELNILVTFLRQSKGNLGALEFKTLVWKLFAEYSSSIRLLRGMKFQKPVKDKLLLGLQTESELLEKNVLELFEEAVALEEPEKQSSRSHH